MREYLELTDAIADWGIIFAFVGVVAFTFSYAFFFSWRKTPPGRALMGVGFALLGVALLSLLGRWYGPHYWGREILRPVVWWSVAYTVTRLLWVLWASWRTYSPIDIPSRDHKETIVSTPQFAKTAGEAGVAPTIWYQGQRVLRSIVGAIVVLVPVANGVAAAAIAYLTSQTDVTIPPVVFVWLNAIVAATALIIGLASKIMAVPGVNDLLVKIGLGSVPRSALVSTDATGAVKVEEDPKVTPVG